MWQSLSRIQIVAPSKRYVTVYYMGAAEPSLIRHSRSEETRTAIHETRRGRHLRVIAGLDFTPPPFSLDLLATLCTLVLFLRTLPTPATHPSRPVANTIHIQTTLTDVQRGYADMRGTWNRRDWRRNR